MLLALVSACDQSKKNTPEENKNIVISNSGTQQELTEAFKSYWYSGEAEITTYQLEQARYGEIRSGKAALIFVTEDFNPKKQVKADAVRPDNISVLKLNSTKNFNTGIYPYSIMQSTFYPVSYKGHAIKVTSSMQEWCGHVYTQLNNRNEFEIKSHSYFESESDQELSLSKNILENELWTQLRIDPTTLPIGEHMVIPSFEFIRLKHIEIKPYQALLMLSDSTYKVEFPDLNRQLTINFNSEFPYDISGWEESFISGYGSAAQKLTTKATKLKTIRSAYWGKNSNADEVLRTELQLD